MRYSKFRRQITWIVMSGGWRKKDRIVGKEQ